MKEDRLKLNVEIHVVGDGTTYINYWNSINGDDVVAELRNGKLYWDVNDVEFECSIQDFIGRVKESYKSVNQ